MRPAPKSNLPPRLPRPMIWIVAFLVYAVIFILLFSYRYLDDLTRQHTGTFGVRFLEEFTGVFSFFALLPLMFRAAEYYLFEKCDWSWLRKVAFHFLCGIGFSLAHTTMMAVSRH